MQVRILKESTQRQFTAITSAVVKGADDFRRPHTPTQTIRPEQVQITFTRSGSSRRWSGTATVSGPRMLTTGHLGSPLSEDFNGSMESAPQWVRDVVEARVNALNAESGIRT